MKFGYTEWFDLGNNQENERACFSLKYSLDGETGLIYVELI